MSKPGRNDPCPCGSGKKSKKCCGQDNVVQFNLAIYNDSLNELQGNLIEFAFENFENELVEQTKNYVELYITDKTEETLENYVDLVTTWFILRAPTQNGKTIFDLFYAREKNKITHPTVNKLFSTWGQMQPAVYEIVAHEDTIEFTDVVTTNTYHTPIDEDFEYTTGNLAIGILVPYVNTHHFFFSMIEIPDQAIEKTLDFVEDTIQHGNVIDDVFPQFISGVTQEETEAELTWDTIHHERVALLFEKHALKKGLDQDLIKYAVQFWNLYSKQNYPIIRKPEANAAALDYFAQATFMEHTHDTQAQLAKEYGTSAGTISNHFRKLVDAMDRLDANDAPSSHPLQMEREIHNIQKALEAQEFDSEEEAQAFMNDLLKDGKAPQAPQDDRDIAQDLIFEAHEKQGNPRKKLIEKALKIYPNSPDAYLLLADDAQDRDERMKWIIEAFNAGAKDFGVAFTKEHAGHFWGMVETRPYMRARAAFAKELDALDEIDNAIYEYEGLLELNPNDNQGMRYLLLPLYIMEEQFKKAKKLIEEYNEPSATFVFNKALLHYKMNGLTKEGMNLLKQAHTNNPYVIDYLRGDKKIPHTSFDYVGMGDESEAIVYLQRNNHLWKDAKEFLQKL